MIYAADLKKLAMSDDVDVTFVYTREAPPGEPRVGRVDAELLAAKSFAPADDLTTYVCGPTPFVEAVAEALVQLGHDPQAIKTERFGSTGG